MDPVGRTIAQLHTMLGHDRTAAFLGQEPGDKDQCVLCRYERYPTDENRAAVVAAIGRPAGSEA